MKSILTSLLLFLAIPVNANDVNFKYCQEFIENINRNSQMTNLSYPFSIDDKGKINRSKMGRDWDFKDDGDGDFYFTKYALNNGVKVIKSEVHVSLDMDGVLQSVNYDTVFLDEYFKLAPHAPVEALQKSHGFDVKDGKCYPEYTRVEQFSRDGMSDKTAWEHDVLLCRDIKKYFDKNQNLRACFDVKSKQNQAINKIFEDNDIPTNQVLQEYLFSDPYRDQVRGYSTIEQNIAQSISKDLYHHVGPNSPKELKDKIQESTGFSPAAAANRILTSCYEKGLRNVINDDEFWGDQPSVTPLSQPSPIETKVLD